MNTIDIVLLVIFLIAFFMGFTRGFLLTLASLAGIIVAVYGAFYFRGYAAGYLNNWTEWSAQLIDIFAFMITFFIIVLVFSLLGRLLTKVADFAALGIFNKLLGGIFNALKYAFIISVLFMFLNNSKSGNGLISEDDKTESYLYAPVASIAPIFLPKILNEVEDYKYKIEQNEQPENHYQKTKNDSVGLNQMQKSGLI